MNQKKAKQLRREFREKFGYKDTGTVWGLKDYQVNIIDKRGKVIEEVKGQVGIVVQPNQYKQYKKQHATNNL